VFPDWQRQLAKFASVQDRLREWKPETSADLKHFSCLAIQALDLDGIRIDKATQVTVDFMADWANATRACARQYNKDNFFIPGEITGGDTFGALYVGRGRTPTLSTSRRMGDTFCVMRDKQVSIPQHSITPFIVRCVDSWVWTVT
jgi:alpha-1,3-glucan synthase